jgi:hypothetical protein
VAGVAQVPGRQGRCQQQASPSPSNFHRCPFSSLPVSAQGDVCILATV